MTATCESAESDTTATQGVRLRFDLIDAKTAEKLGITVEQVYDRHIADLVGVGREAVSRWRNGRFLPRLDVAHHIAEVYGLTVNDLIQPPTEAGE